MSHHHLPKELYEACQIQSKDKVKEFLLGTTTTSKEEQHDNDSTRTLQEQTKQWLVPLIETLLFSSDTLDTNNNVVTRNQALWMVTTLVSLDHEISSSLSSSFYSLIISQVILSVLVANDIQQSQSQSPPKQLELTPDLIQIWMQQLLWTESMAVHSNLSKAILEHVLQPNGNSYSSTNTSSRTTIFKTVFQSLTDSWQHAWNNNEKNIQKNRSSIVLVRCATFWMQALFGVGETTKATGTGTATLLLQISHELDITTQWFPQVLHDTYDPLLQISLLDAMIQVQDNLQQQQQQQQQPLLLQKRDTTHNGVMSMDIHQNNHDNDTHTSNIHNTNANTNGLKVVQEYFASFDLVEPLLVLLQDPLLSGAVLQYLTWIVSISDPATTNNDATNSDNDNNNKHMKLLDIVLHHIQETIGVTTDESDRLQVIHALLRLSTTTSTFTITNNDNIDNDTTVTLSSSSSSSSSFWFLSKILLSNPTLRSCWWDMKRLSSPKLQAAILCSLAKLLEFCLEHNNNSLGLKLYRTFGQDNNHYNTTQWIFTKYIKSPMPELRIAAYRVWTQLVQLKNGISALLLNNEDVIAWLVTGSRELTVDARTAKYEFLATLYHESTAKSSTSTTSADTMVSSLTHYNANFSKKLKELVDLGPHGIQPQTWDVAME